MTIDRHTAKVTLDGLELAAGASIADLREARPDELQLPVIANGEFETYRLVSSEAVSLLVFKSGQLWKLQISLSIPEDASRPFDEASERLRHALHQSVLQRLIGADHLECPNGSKLLLCFDARSMASTIDVTF